MHQLSLSLYFGGFAIFCPEQAQKLFQDLWGEMVCSSGFVGRDGLQFSSRQDRDGLAYMKIRVH